MSQAKSAPVSTAQYVAELEKIRVAVEVFFGERVDLVYFDFNTDKAKAKVRVGERDLNVRIISVLEFVTHFILEEGEYSEDGVWLSVRTDFETGEVRVIAGGSIPKRGPHGQHAMWWVGRSATERRLEPIESDVVARYARLRGVSIEEYLSLEA